MFARWLCGGRVTGCHTHRARLFIKKFDETARGSRSHADGDACLRTPAFA